MWRKEDGPADGWSLEDENQNVVEFNETTDGGALAARFTCFRTWPNGPRGTFVAMSLTRATSGSLLTLTNNMQVANLACSIVQAESELAVGVDLVLDDDGHATEDAIRVIEDRVNAKLQIELLSKKKEGQRASEATWRARRDDVLNVENAELNAVLDLRLNGVLVKINTVTRVQTAG